MHTSPPQQPPQQPPPLAYRPATAAKALGISRAALYRELQSGRLASCRAGAIRLITREALLAWLEDREAEAGTHTEARH